MSDATPVGRHHPNNRRRNLFLILGAVWGIRASLESGRLRSAGGMDPEARPIASALRQTTA